ncbi:MAG: hypothetical protein AAGA84_03695 [Pseudomonadota bacterium]
MNKLQKYSRKLADAANREQSIAWRGDNIEVLSEHWEEAHELFGLGSNDHWLPPTKAGHDETVG